jgi:cellobiose epimerase
MIRNINPIIKIIIITLTFSFGYCGKNHVDSPLLLTDKDSISTEIKKLLDQDFDLWYPLCIDTVYGGYYSDINYKWQLEGEQNKMIVSQARHVWSASNAAMFYEDNTELLKVAEHGFKFLRDVMWDKEFSGFYDLVDRKGNPLKENGELIKKAYGNSFAIYGLAAYYKVSGNMEALKLAKETFFWLEKFSYDKHYGGYFQFITREGEPRVLGFGNYPSKDQNSSIHLLECFTELYKVWPDKLLRERLLSLLAIIRDKITTPKGYMDLFFTKDWTPISYRDSTPEERIKNFEFDHVSFGHDIETAYLLLETNEILGVKNDSVTNIKAKKMFDHTLKYGWDKEYGGIFDGGYYFKNKNEPKIVENTKEWWAQAEALNSLLLMSFIYHAEKKYYQKFCEQWNYIKTYLIDNEYGGWFWGGTDQLPANKYANKGSIWKVNYHTSRSLINCIKILKNHSSQ